MNRKNKSLFRLVGLGLFSILFLTLMTISFYGYVLEQIGVDHAESPEYTMVDLMDMSIAAKVDGILMECTDEENLDEKVNEASEKGIPVIMILNDAPATERKSFVGINPYQLGQAYGGRLEEMVQSLVMEQERITRENAAGFEE